MVDVPVLDPVRALTRTTYQLSAFISPEWEGEFLRHCGSHHFRQVGMAIRQGKHDVGHDRLAK